MGLKGLRQAVKNNFAAAHFAWRVPVYWRLYQSQRLRWAKRMPYDVIFFDKDTHFRGPDLTVGHEIFESMAFESPGHTEGRNFLKLAAGCSRFVDLGASGGVFSALFAATRPTCHILSVEPDPPSFNALRSTRDKNLGPGISWDCDDRGVATSKGTTRVHLTGYGLGVIPVEGSEASPFEMRTTTLEALCTEWNITPDLIKFDVESMEYEIITQSADYLRKLRPRLHLELHTPMIRSRGLEEADVLTLLYDIGYRLCGVPDHSFARLRRAAPETQIARLDLISA